MMPMPPPQGPEGPGSVPVGPGPGAQSGADQPSPDTIKAQLKMLLTKAKQMAEANGVNFSEVIAEVEGNKVKSEVPLPRPPAPGM
jgi:hypothetical protein